MPPPAPPRGLMRKQSVRSNRSILEYYEGSYSRNLKVSEESWNDFHTKHHSESFSRSSEHIFERGNKSQKARPPFLRRSLSTRGPKGGGLFRSGSDDSLAGPPKRGVRRNGSDDSLACRRGSLFRNSSDDSLSASSCHSERSLGRPRRLSRSLKGNIKLDSITTS